MNYNEIQDKFLELNLYLQYILEETALNCKSLNENGTLDIFVELEECEYEVYNDYIVELFYDDDNILQYRTENGCSESVESLPFEIRLKILKEIEDNI